MVSERVVCHAFIGRAQELDHLLARRRLAGDGQGGAVLVAGEAGIGKSRLLREFRSRLTPAWTQSASANCREFAQRPLEPLAEIFAQLGPPADNPLERRSLSKSDQLAAVSAALQRSADRRATVIFLEDLHWADIELLRTLAVLAERAASQRILFVASYRANEIVSSHPLFGALGRLLREPSTSHLVLEPLASDETARLVAVALGDRQHAVTAAKCNDVVRRSGGNPFFAEELLRHAVDHRFGADARRARALPISIEAVVRERIARCTPEERTFLREAAIFGRRFRVDLLEEIFGLSTIDRRPTLQRLCELQLIDPVAGRPFDYAFRHALTRDVVYGDMLPAQTRPLHLKIAETLERRADAAAFPEQPAHNFWEAGELERAAPYCEAAGDAARDLVYAYEDAAAWYERAAAAFGERADARGRVLAKATDVLVRCDALENAIETHRRAIEALTEAGDLEGAVLSRMSVFGALGNAGRTREAIDLATATLAMLVGGDRRELRERVLIRLAAVHAAIRHADDGLRVLEAVDEATLAPDSRYTGEYYLIRASLAAQREGPDAWRRYSSLAVSTLERSGAPQHTKKTALGSLALQALQLGETAPARDYQRKSLELALLLRSDEAYARAGMARIEIRCGNLAAARELLEGAGSARTFLPKWAISVAGMELAVALGDERMLEKYLDLELIGEAFGSGVDSAAVSLAAAAAPALTELGREAEGTELLRRASEIVRLRSMQISEIATIALSAPEFAAPLRSLLAEFAAQRADRVNAALLALVDSVLARRDGDAGFARERARAAARAFNEIGWPLFEAACLEAAGDVAGALRIYRRCGAAGPVRRLKQAQDGGAVRSALDTLTPRERELALRVAAGDGNRAAARALSVSEKAVEKYLTTIYQKLGVSSRSQLAALIAASRPGAAVPGGR